MPQSLLFPLQTRPPAAARAASPVTAARRGSACLFVLSFINLPSHFPTWPLRFLAPLPFRTRRGRSPLCFPWETKNPLTGFASRAACRGRRRQKNRPTCAGQADRVPHIRERVCCMPNLRRNLSQTVDSAKNRSRPFVLMATLYHILPAKATPKIIIFVKPLSCFGAAAARY